MEQSYKVYLICIYTYKDTVEIYFIDIDICISMSMFMPKVITMDNNKYRIRGW